MLGFKVLIKCLVPCLGQTSRSFSTLRAICQEIHLLILSFHDDRSFIHFPQVGDPLHELAHIPLDISFR